jgi:hypothetical protein
MCCINAHHCLRWWYWLNTTYARGGVAVREGKIMDACPIYRRWKGQSLERMLAYLKQRRQFIELVALYDINRSEVE